MGNAQQESSLVIQPVTGSACEEKLTACTQAYGFCCMHKAFALYFQIGTTGKGSNISIQPSCQAGLIIRQLFSPFVSFPLFACNHRILDQTQDTEVAPHNTVGLLLSLKGAHKYIEIRRTIDKRPAPVCFPTKFSSAKREP